MALVETASGMNVQVSDEDFENVSKKRWWVQKDHTKDKYYVYTEERKLCPVLQRMRRHKIYLHRFLTNCPVGWVVDHRDNDGLNNRRWNLRVASFSQNAANHHGYQGLCIYRGVSKSKCRKPYRARIYKDGVETLIGCFDNPEQAARAYDAKAIELYGEFAWLNFDTRYDIGLAEQDEERRQIEEIPF